MDTDSDEVLQLADMPELSSDAERELQIKRDKNAARVDKKMKKLV